MKTSRDGGSVRSGGGGSFWNPRYSSLRAFAWNYSQMDSLALISSTGAAPRKMLEVELTYLASGKGWKGSCLPEEVMVEVTVPLLSPPPPCMRRQASDLSLPQLG